MEFDFSIVNVFLYFVGKNMNYVRFNVFCKNVLYIS